MKLWKVLVLILLTAIISASSAWFITYTYFFNKSVPILSLTPSNNPSYMYDYTTRLCQPNMMNSSCSKVIEETLNMVSQDYQAKLREKPQVVYKESSQPSMQFTNCYDTFSGVNCFTNSY